VWESTPAGSQPVRRFHLLADAERCVREHVSPKNLSIRNPDGSWRAHVSALKSVPASERRSAERVAAHGELEIQTDPGRTGDVSPSERLRATVADTSEQGVGVVMPPGDAHVQPRALVWIEIEVGGNKVGLPARVAWSHGASVGLELVFVGDRGRLDFRRWRATASVSARA